jgi:SAM-dependent methyltransferase
VAADVSAAHRTREAPQRDHFSALVAQWSHFGPPLRPSPEDTAVVRRAIAALPRQARAVVQGLTPETLGCPWPPDASLFAVDHSAAMIAALWPLTSRPPQAAAVRADWRALPFAAGTIDLVAGDGCYPSFSYPDGYASLSDETARVLRAGGLYVTRLFLRLDEPEPIAAVTDALARGEIGSVHALKLRLLAALHGASGAGTLLDDVWQAWKTLPALPPSRVGTRGWTPDEITGIEGYRGLGARYYLPTLAEAQAVFAPRFVEVDRVPGAHELGARCPTFTLARRG